MSTDIEAYERCIRKCDEEAASLKRSGCLGQARVAEKLAASMRSMLSAANERNREAALATDRPGAPR